MKTFIKTIVAATMLLSTAAVVAQPGDTAKDNYQTCMIASASSTPIQCASSYRKDCYTEMNKLSVGGWSCEVVPIVKELPCGYYTNEDGYMTMRNVYVGSADKVIGPVLFYEVEPLIFEVKEYIDDYGVKHIIE